MAHGSNSLRVFAGVLALALATPGSSHARSKALLAVYPVEDTRSAKQLGAREIDDLSELLSKTIASSGLYRVVPYRQLRSALDDKRTECHEQRCRIEISGSIRADKALGVRLGSEGAQCTLDATILDVRKEAVERSVSRQAACDPDSLIEGVKALAAALDTRKEGGKGKGGRASSALQSVGPLVAVPGGAFYFGCNRKADTECLGNERVVRTVQVSGFRIDRTEVTVEDYGSCVKAGACSAEGLNSPHVEGKAQPDAVPYCNWGKEGRERHPINCVDWSQAQAYCAFVSKRLPTEVEWEKAARGTDGRKYAWGNEGYSVRALANIADETVKERFPAWSVAAGYEDGFAGTAPVGSFPAGESPYGALDMMGNVSEWTADWYQTGKYRVARGGAWNSLPMAARASVRDGYDPWSRYAFIGFRCVE